MQSDDHYLVWTQAADPRLARMLWRLSAWPRLWLDAGAVCLLLSNMPRSSNTEKGATTLQTAERALAFLESVALAARPPQLRDVSDELKLNITTCYHLFNTLHKAGYLVRDSSGGLRVGTRVAVLYQGLVRHFDIGRDLHPVVNDLSDSTNETAYLTSYSGRGVVVEAVVEAAQAVRVSGLYVGFSGQEHMRASGQAVLAHLPEPERGSVLDRCLDSVPELERKAALEHLDRELPLIRRRGYAVDEQMFQKSVCCIAAPFFGVSGAATGSIAVSVPDTRYGGARKKLAKAVMDAASVVSSILGYQATATPDPTDRHTGA